MRKMRVLGVAAITAGLFFGATGIAAAAEPVADAPVTFSADAAAKGIPALLNQLTAGSSGAGSSGKLGVGTVADAPAQAPVTFSADLAGKGIVALLNQLATGSAKK